MSRVEGALKALHTLRQQGDRSVRGARLLGITREESGAAPDFVDDRSGLDPNETAANDASLKRTPSKGGPLLNPSPLPQAVRDAVKIARKHAALCRAVFLVSESPATLEAAGRQRTILASGVDGAIAFLESLIAEMWGETLTASATPWGFHKESEREDSEGGGHRGGGHGASGAGFDSRAGSRGGTVTAGDPSGGFVDRSGIALRQGRIDRSSRRAAPKKIKTTDKGDSTDGERMRRGDSPHPRERGDGTDGGANAGEGSDGERSLGGGEGSLGGGEGSPMSARDFDDDSAGGGFETTGTRGGNSSELGETTNGAANRGAGSRPNSAANAAAENVSSNLSGRKRARGERENHHSAPDRRSDRSDPGVAPGSPDSRAARAEGDSDVGTSGESGDESRSSSESRGGGDRERGDGGGSIPGRRGRRGGPGAMTGAGATGSRGATGSLGSLGGGSIAEGKDSEPRRRGRRTPLGGGGERERGMISLKEDSASGSDEAAGGAPGAGANDGEEGGPRSGRAGGGAAVGRRRLALPARAGARKGVLLDEDAPRFLEGQGARGRGHERDAAGEPRGERGHVQRGRRGVHGGPQRAV